MECVASHECRILPVMRHLPRKGDNGVVTLPQTRYAFLSELGGACRCPELDRESVGPRVTA